MSHDVYERRAADLARLGRGGTKTNPLVGAVLTKEQSIIAEGYHQTWGGPHAEVAALTKVKHHDLSHSHLYVTLEPCSHTGKTPPCCDLIVKRSVSRVYIGHLDPNPAVHGNGIRELEKGGAEVSPFSNQHLTGKLLRPFLINQLEARPYIILKWAESLDGLMAKNGEQTKLTNPFSDRLVHKWRSEIDAIMVGTNTAVIDDPSLTTRHFPGENPIRVVVDLHKRIPKDARVFDHESRTLRFTILNRGTTDHVEDIGLSSGGYDLSEIMTALYERHIGVLMVEGGSSLLQSFLEVDLWDECRIFRTSHILSEGVSAPTMKVTPIARYNILDDRLSLYIK